MTAEGDGARVHRKSGASSKLALGARTSTRPRVPLRPRVKGRSRVTAKTGTDSVFERLQEKPLHRAAGA